MRHLWAHTESRKDYDVNFTYTTRIQRQLSYMSDPYKLQYFICDTRGPTRNPGKITTYNFPYMRNLQIHCSLELAATAKSGSSACIVVGRKRSACFAAESTRIGHRSMLFSRPETTVVINQAHVYVKPSPRYQLSYIIATSVC